MRAAAVATALAIVATAGVVLAPAAQAAAVVIDDFNGSTLGTRNVTALPVPDTSTTAPGTFSQSGGFGTAVMGGNGNGIGGVQLTYDFPAGKDLTSGGLNKQFYLEFQSIQRLPNPTNYSTALTVSISARDTAGTTGTYNTGINSGVGQNVALNLDCSVNSVCFSPQPNFAAINQVTVTLKFPQNKESVSTTTAILDVIRTTPLGGATPDAPAVSFVVPTATPTYGTPATPISVSIPVSTTQTITDHLAASEISLTTTGTVNTTVGSVTWNSSTKTYAVSLTNTTGNGTIQLKVPAGAIVDSWDQGNAAAQSTPFEYRTVTPPVFIGPASLILLKGQASTAAVTATNNGPSIEYAVSGGSLPEGIALNTATGALTGTPTTTGIWAVQFSATNLGGITTANCVIMVYPAPTFTSPDTADFAVGAPGSFAITATGQPAPTLTLVSGSVPGLTFSPGSGGATLSGTATTPGLYTLTVNAASAGGVATQTLAVSVTSKAQFIAPPAQVSAQVGEQTSMQFPFIGYPKPTLTIGGDGLPAGLTASVSDSAVTISGTPESSGAGIRSVTLSLTNSSGTATHSFQLTVGSPAAITSAAATTVTVGQSLSFPVTATGVPTPVVTVTNLPMGLTYNSGTGVIGGAVATPGTYTVTVTASNASGPAATQTLTIRVVQGPAFTSPAEAPFRTGTAGSFTVTTSGYPAAAISSADQLPAGLTLTDNGDGTATISGTPTQFGLFIVMLSADNGDFPSASQWLALTINRAPTVTASDQTAQVDKATSFTINASGYPVPTLTVTGLPAGLTASTTGYGGVTVSGTPANGTGGVYTIDVTASNSVDSVSTSLTLTVEQPPAFTSADGVTFTLGQSASFAVASTGYPAAALSISGTLPQGVDFVDAGDGSATIAGAPSEDGVFPITITADNGIGDKVSQSFTLTVFGDAPYTGDLSIVGDGTAGAELSVSSSIAGTLTGSQVTGQWLRDGVEIPGATAATWTPTNADAGATITYRAFVAAPQHVTATVDAQNSVAVVGNISVGELTVSGSAVVDGVLQANLAGVDPADADVTYAWKRGETTVSTEADYSPVAQDVANSLTVTATVTAAHFHTRTVTKSVGPVILADFLAAPTVAIVGTVQVGDVLEASVTDAVPAATGLSYQWLADGKEIAAADGATLQLKAAQKGAAVSVRITATRLGYAQAVVTSSATAAVATNEAPRIDFTASRSQLRRGQSATLTWKATDAVTVRATGAWAGARGASGSVSVAPVAIGSNVYRIAATNHIGTTTAQVVIGVRRSAAALKVKVSKRRVVTGRKASVRVSNLDANEHFTVRIAGRVVGKGRAKANGTARITVRVPKTAKSGAKVGRRATVKVVGEIADRKGKAKIATLPASSGKKLRVSVSSPYVRASSRQTVTIRNLAPRERVRVRVGGTKGFTRTVRARKSGTAKVTIKNVGIYWGKRTVKVRAVKSKRTGSGSYTVVSRF
ncbi:beta strand repeat-containing protein [Rarobacter incanus]|uniref:beta strand repeat-containing protein n=1 Tax=Rarobacter incanus TaxID=153494 RepID=UPI0014769FA0|nr:putative Ig domain-containing protein [Rarobacter incanus]